MKPATSLLTALALITALAAPGSAEIKTDVSGRPIKPDNEEEMEEYYKKAQKWLEPIEKEFERLQAETLEAITKATKEQVKFTQPNIRYSKFIGGGFMLMPIPAMMACIGDKPCFSLMNCLEKPDLCKEGQTEAGKVVAKFKEEVDANIAQKKANDEQIQQEAANDFTAMANDRNNRATGKTPDADPQGDKGGGMTVASNDDNESENPTNPSNNKDPEGGSATTEAASDASGGGSLASRDAQAAPTVKKAGPELVAQIVVDEVHRIVGGTFASLENVWNGGVNSYQEAGAADVELKGQAVAVPSAGPDNTSGILIQQASKIFDKAKNPSQLSGANEKLGGAVRAIPLECPPGIKCG